jgi:hypothetical protein
MFVRDGRGRAVEAEKRVDVIGNRERSSRASQLPRRAKHTKTSKKERRRLRLTR